MSFLGVSFICYAYFSLTNRAPPRYKCSSHGPFVPWKLGISPLSTPRSNFRSTTQLISLGEVDVISLPGMRLQMILETGFRRFSRANVTTKCPPRLYQAATPRGIRHSSNFLKLKDKWLGRSHVVCTTEGRASTKTSHMSRSMGASNTRQPEHSTNGDGDIQWQNQWCDDAC